ncbi:P43 5S RNA-binding protein [Bombina bombina]|uniref:P43 5S RNA-binding protein n=1 Tax=Bombina bombina TaxID=8345 RepID=UPI00235A6C94|nr:P43 5S RNA-binding protein [Bombina bombina]
MDYNKTTVDFLDLRISIQGDVLGTTLFQKIADRNSLLQATSCHPAGLKRALPISQFKRVVRNNSDPEKAKEQLLYMKERFLQRGYRQAHIEQHLSKFWNMKQEEALCTREPSGTENRLTYLTTYTADKKEVPGIVRDQWNIVTSDPTLPFTTMGPPRVTYRRGRSLRDTLVKVDPVDSYKKTTWLQSPKVGCYRCLGCTTCSGLSNTKTFSHPHTNRKCTIRYRVTCTTEFIVYLLHCPCGLFYVGKTVDTLRICMANHRSAIRLAIREKESEQPVARHFAMCGHTKPWRCNNPGCDQTYTRRSYLHRHKLQQHTDVKGHSCTSAGCRAAFKTKKCLKRHILYKHGKDCPLTCSVSGCKQTFQKRNLLKRHLSEQHNEPVFVCDFPGCSWKSNRSSHLTAHRRRHAGYRCSYKDCQVVSPTWTSLQEHRKKHPLSLQCAKCGKDFKKQSSLHKHQDKHKEPSPRLPCPREDCSETFTTVFSLTHHVRKAHLCLQTHRCYHAGCSRIFSMRESLIRHLVIHDPERKKLKLKFNKELSKTSRRNIHRTLPVVEEDLSRLFNQKLLFRCKTQMESNLSGLFNERLLRDQAEPEVNLSGLFQLPTGHIKTEKVV